ncbi:hypothetical protein Tco_0132212 [Tanacetum coccineum]
MVPRAVLMKTGLKTFNTARTVNNAHPKSIVFSAKPMSCFPKIAQSTVRRPFQTKTALSNKRFTHKVNTAKAQAVNTARPQAVNTARPKIVKIARPNSAVVNAIRVNQENAGKPQQDDTGFVDSGCSRHMTRNIAYLSCFKEFEGGSVWMHPRTPRYLSLVVPLKKVGNEAVHKELGVKMERAATTASSLEAEQDSGSGPRCQDTILGDVDAQTRFETTSKHSNDPPFLRGYTLGSGEDSMKLLELMELCTKLSNMLHKNRKSDLIRYALTINPTIYTSCIEQFWETARAKTVNSERQIQALIDKKKVIIMKSSIRSDLYLEDAGGIDCLPTATIFKELFLIHTITQCLSAKSIAWNEFSSTMASLIICLATNQKFNLSKYIFDAMVKHLDGGVKFLMYLRFLQVFINQNLGDMSHHKKIYVNPSHTKKIFANMRREGKDFSGRVTPLFETMMVQPNQEEGVDSGIPTDSQQTPITTQPSSYRSQKK